MTRQKLAKQLNGIFGWGVLITIVAGSLTFFGFIIAMILGGAAGEALAVFIRKQYFPIVICATSVIIGVGLVAMYVGGEQALSLTSDKKEAEQELEQIKAEQEKSADDPSDLK